MKIKMIQTITTFTLILSAYSAQPVIAKVNKDEVLVRILETAREWKKSHRFEAKASASLDAQLALIGDTERLLSHSELDTDLRAKLEKVRGDALARIAQSDERGAPYVVFEYILAFRNQMKNLDKETHKVAVNRYKALEDSIQKIGLKAIPFLTDLNAAASRKKASALSDKTMDLISRIAKKGDLEVEQAKIQIEFNKKARADEAIEDSKTRVAEGHSTFEHTELPRLDIQGNGIESIDMNPRSLDSNLAPEKQN